MPNSKDGITDIGYGILIEDSALEVAEALYGPGGGEQFVNEITEAAKAMTNQNIEYRGVNIIVDDDAIADAKAAHGMDLIAEIKSAIDYRIDVLGEAPDEIKGDGSE